MAEAASATDIGRRDARRTPSRRKKKGRRVGATAVDIDGRVLRIARACRCRGRLAVTKLAVEPFPSDLDPSDSVAFASWVRAVLGGHRVRRGAVVLGVSRQHAILRRFDLPDPGDLSELASMVRLAFARELPFPAEDAVIDFAVHAERNAAASGRERGESGAEPRVRVLAAAVRKDLVGDARALAAAAGFRLAALGLRSYANVRCAELCGLGGAGSTGALVSLRSDEAIIDVVEGHDLAFSRSVPLSPPSAGGIDAAEATAAVVTEVSRSVRSYEAHGGHGHIEWVAVAGATGSEERIAADLRNALEVPSSLLDPARHLEFVGAAKRASDESRASTAVIGLALSALGRRGLPFDFLHPRKPKSRSKGRWGRKVLALAALVALGVLVFGVRERLLGDEHARAATFEGEVARLTPFERSFDLRIREGRSIAEWVESDPRWLEHWAWLSRILPESRDVRVTSFTTGGSDTIRLSLLSRTAGIIESLFAKLEEAGYDVKPLPVTPASDAGGYGYKTTVTLLVPRGMKPHALWEASPAGDAPSGANAPQARADETASSGAAKERSDRANAKKADADPSPSANAVVEKSGDRGGSRRARDGSKRRSGRTRSDRVREAVAEAER